MVIQVAALMVDEMYRRNSVGGSANIIANGPGGMSTNLVVHWQSAFLHGVELEILIRVSQRLTTMVTASLGQVPAPT